MNADTISPQNDMGRDGLSVNGAKFQPKDVLGYVIHYYNRDYKPITKGPFDQDSTGISKFATASPNLYNGNIRAISQHNLQLGRSIGYAYGYDQLHRIATMDAWKATTTQNLWQTTTASADYQERVSYDANGNITKYKRNKDAGITQDSLNYKYNTGTNQLQYITDNVANNVSTTDIDNQSPNNYIYDKSGNMVADSAQSMSVSWSPYGKILTNTKAGGANLSFGYNAMQQRVLKRVVLAGDTTRTYYIRDAQGNTMGVYTRHNDSVSWREQYIFGSSRLGLYRADTLVNKGLQTISKLYEGKRNYELTNHLGNVLAVINDRKTDSLSGTTKVGYNAVVISATDYFPFGMAIDSRSYTSSLYRYGFNGKENDKETGEQDYGMRIYDPKIAKFLSVDILITKYPNLTPYQFSGNSPIAFTDLDGGEPTWPQKPGEAITTKPIDIDWIKKLGFNQQMIQGTTIDPISRLPKAEIIPYQAGGGNRFGSDQIWRMRQLFSINYSMRKGHPNDQDKFYKGSCTYDCITVTIQATKLLYAKGSEDIPNYPSPTDEYRSVNSWMKNMASAGMAGNSYEVHMADKNNRKDDDNASNPTQYFGRTLTETLSKAAEESDSNVFGMALFGGYHSIVITKEQNGDFTLHDEYSYGVRRFSPQELDAHILKEASRLRPFVQNGRPWSDRYSLLIEIRPIKAKTK